MELTATALPCTRGASGTKFYPVVKRGTRIIKMSTVRHDTRKAALASANAMLERLGGVIDQP